MPHRDLVVIGASAGGVEALRALAASLPADLPAAVAVVLHVPPYSASSLPAILDRAGPMPAQHAEHGQHIEPGRMYIAMPDYHLTVHEGQFGLSRGPRENGHRPSIDVLFRSAARAFGTRVIGVVLSGALDDGTAGLATIRERGGVTMVQDPADAMYPAMPESALAQVPVDHVLPMTELAEVLIRLAGEQVVAAPAPTPSRLLRREAAVAGLDENGTAGQQPLGSPAGFSCPDCSGSLYEVWDNDLVRYRCRVGHAWSAESLLARQGFALESALWMALRNLEEKAELSAKLAGQSDIRGNMLSAERFRTAADDAARATALIRKMLESGAGFAPDPGGTG